MERDALAAWDGQKRGRGTGGAQEKGKEVEESGKRGRRGEGAQEGGRGVEESGKSLSEAIKRARPGPNDAPILPNSMVPRVFPNRVVLAPGEVSCHFRRFPHGDFWVQLLKERLVQAAPEKGYPLGRLKSIRMEPFEHPIHGGKDGTYSGAVVFHEGDELNRKLKGYIWLNWRQSSPSLMIFGNRSCPYCCGTHFTKEHHVYHQTRYGGMPKEDATIAVCNNRNVRSMAGRDLPCKVMLDLDKPTRNGNTGVFYISTDTNVELWVCLRPECLFHPPPKADAKPSRRAAAPKAPSGYSHKGAMRHLKSAKHMGSVSRQISTGELPKWVLDPFKNACWVLRGKTHDEEPPLKDPLSEPRTVKEQPEEASSGVSAPEAAPPQEGGAATPAPEAPSPLTGDPAILAPQMPPSPKGDPATPVPQTPSPIQADQAGPTPQTPPLRRNTPQPP